MHDLSVALLRYLWADEDDDLAWTVSVVKGVSEPDVVMVFGGEIQAVMQAKSFREARVPEDEFGSWFYLQTVSTDDHVVALENNGWSGSVPEIARRASAGGGEFFSVYWNINGLYQILQARDGRVEACFNPMFVGEPAGTHDLLPPCIEGVEFELAHLGALCLGLMEQQTGVAFPREWLDVELPSYRIPDVDVLLRDVGDARVP